MRNLHNNAADIKSRISLVALLARLGYEPLRKAGRELLYLSMLRDSDTKPSFCVNENLNVWYDHGTGKGGNIIDFGMAYWQLNFKSTLKKIGEVTGDDCQVPEPLQTGVRRHATKLPHYHIEAILDLGTTGDITAYLRERGVWNAAHELLKEIHYYVEDEKKQRKYFYAAGWQNQSGSWEVRNRYFKGCLGHKAITFIPGAEDRVAVFEGFINYLSWLTERPYSPDSILVLNSLALLPSGIRAAREFTDVNIYFDRDLAGWQATAAFIKAMPQSIDCSCHQPGHSNNNYK
ncbi:CHC2 zinc finger domain-containing protein [Mucilaginibacter sp. X5P1]|uniref:CHC2 zinc finger domain-containing protein n=1 Tax=Mucilaginibacter sp. X5P1 TaxID=2723088 RepID=UPI00160DD945|nr:CHC2 zinc finger domain-containing protein [Mucilaginibacter sp. X5P1]MBB6137677.1 DNA primase [Mucilaginibacter sp. X5P1]